MNKTFPLSEEEYVISSFKSFSLALAWHVKVQSQNCCCCFLLFFFLVMQQKMGNAEGPETTEISPQSEGGAKCPEAEEHNGQAVRFTALWASTRVLLQQGARVLTGEVDRRGRTRRTEVFASPNQLQPGTQPGHICEYTNGRSFESFGAVSKEKLPTASTQR